MKTDRLKQLLALLQNQPDDEFLHFAVAKEYESLGDDLTAQTYYERLLTLNPLYVGAYYHLGKLLERAGDLEQAAMLYRKGMTVAQQLNDPLNFRELAAALKEISDEE